MDVIALVAPPVDPAVVQSAYAALLGPEFRVSVFGSQADVSDDVAGTAVACVAAAGCTVDARLFKRAPALKLVQIPGHGFDHVSVTDAETAGVAVATVASSGAEAHTVAEMALLLAGVAGRRIMQGDRFVRDGNWGPLLMLQQGVFELAGKTLGIVGLGRIGRELATRATAFGMRVVYFDVVKAETDLEFMQLDDLLAAADVVSLHAPLTPATRFLINERTLSLMKPTAVLVNTARGPLVDAHALADALREGRLRAAAIDVFDAEPPGPDHPLLGLDNVVLSPHMAGVTADSILRILAAAFENVRRLYRGEPLHDVLPAGAEH
ncbi:MAG: 2-hydroxyacid dehydrogenase [Actinomycetota bacterium]